jgi:hypothetical protein
MPLDDQKTVEPWLLERVVRADAWDLAVRAVNPFPPTLSRLIHIHARNYLCDDQVSHYAHQAQVPMLTVTLACVFPAYASLQHQ